MGTEEAGNHGLSETVRRPRGSVLIMVVWTVILLSVLVAGMGAQGLLAFNVTERMEHRLQASYLAQAGVQQALKVLAADTTSAVDWLGDVWANHEAMLTQQTLGRGSWTVGIPSGPEASPPIYGLVDEERKLNLNTIPAELFRTLLEDQGQVREDDARRIADAMEDWRDVDDDPRPDGAEQFYYLGLQEAYECHNGPFEQLEELRLVRGMTPEVYARVAPALTVHGSGRVNLNTAGRLALRTLGVSDDGVASFLADRAGPDGQEGTTDDHYLTTVSALDAELATVLSVEDRQRLLQWAQKNLLGVRSEAFQVFVTATVPGMTAPVYVNSVINRSGKILTWAEW